MLFSYNAEKTRKDFPILGKPIIYFDNACMSLKPVQVIDKINEYYNEYSACAGRSAHRFASRVEEEVDKSRNEVRKFINANKVEEIIFTRNTTEGINLVANSIGLKDGDEVIISDKEHNSNLIPWLKMRKKGIKLSIVNTKQDNTFDSEDFKSKISDKTKLVSVVFTSNIDGVTNPIKEISKIAHKNNALVLVDGAQAVPGSEVNVKELDVDFLSFSGHKMLGPTGTGVLYGKKDILEGMEQFIVGGETVLDSTHESYKIEELPMRFEAGLQDYSGIIGLGEACRYLTKIGLSNVKDHEVRLNKLVSDSLLKEPKISILGPKEAEKRNGVFSFNIKGMSPHDVSKILDSSKSIMTRSGMHCVHSWFNKRKLNGSVRASMYLYNTEEEANVFVDEVKKIIKIM
ncbi:MAG TPA: cysteine desulfurase [Candidatus Nanoarchaeia archaeon]|nr:cysteine desulfurase [Candidatus Nanoarchaeia archaeon]